MSLFSWIIIAFLVSSLSFTSSSPCAQNDLQVLRIFSSQYANSSIHKSWTADERCCQWEGVTCENSTVVSLNLAGKDLEGKISPLLGQLDRLKSLNLSCNRLEGSLPSELTQLKLLEALDFSYNSLSGEAGDLISSLPSLQYVNISSNFFGANLTELDGLSNLLEFNASNNSFSGSIPNFNGVRVIDLSMNNLAGNLNGLKNSSASLQQLRLDFNKLEGSLPEFIYSIPTLVHLSISSNNFAGNLSSDLSKLSNLKTLHVDGNRFDAFIPDVFENFTQLEEFVAQSNKFSGPLPSSLSFCSSLRVLNLRNNSLSGSIDLKFSNLRNLHQLDLATNSFTGPLPNSLSDCRQLRTLSLAKNRFNGSIPESFGNLSFLSYLTLSNNSLSRLDQSLSTLQKCRNLSTLILSKNFIGEEIPKDIIEFESLTVLALGNCALIGEIPQWILSCKNLKVLDLSWNHISGSIPSNINVMENLFYMDFSNNSLTGELPIALSEMKSLASPNNSLLSFASAGFPLFVKRNQSSSGLQYNQLSSFPPAIYLSNNQINGTVFPQIGNLKQLHILELSRNNLTGSIPETISQMKNLEILDLSFNDLTGFIPQSLEDLSFLSKFSVAHNNLEGKIPTKGQFLSFPNSWFEGNPDLCGRVKLCSDTKNTTLVNSKRRLSRGSILGITFTICFIFALFLAILFIKFSRRDFKHVVGNAEDGMSTPYSFSESKLVLYQYEDCKDITMADLLKSTNNFNQSNIIGCGGFGLVYKASLPDGSKAAIKRLSGDCGQLEREFHAEVETLSRAQHKNLVPLKGYCCHGNDKFLIYSYMENGSLDYWLHECADGPSLLTWEIRLTIARGAARGLAYLHNTCDPHIVHRDVKSSNILLDDKFEAHLADFGLARLLHPCDTHVTTDLAGTLGYIPPEYSQTLSATCRGDVYSFGVVLLEILTGRRPVEIFKGKNSRDMVTWVFQMRHEQREKEIVDGAIWDGGRESQMLEMLEIACRCLNVDPRKRPLIQDVVSSLDAIRC